MRRLVLEGVTKSYGAVPALRGLDLEAAESELLVLVGPSASGKTTALRVAAGLERPDAGRVVIGDRDVTAVDPAQRGVGMVFQSYALFPHLDVADNIGFGLAVRRVPPAERRARVVAAAEIVGCANLLERRPLELSGGERQRVALARAIVREPEVFLLDEPLSSLDAHLRVRMRTELRELQRRLGATMVYVTHDQVEALTLGDRVAVLDEGRIQQVGTPDEIYGAPANRFVARFIGSPAMNLLAATAERGSLRAGPFLVRRTGLGAARGRDLELGVRPEDVRLASGGRAGTPALVRMVEVAGHETYVHLEAEGIRLIARGEASLRPDEGATVRVSLVATRVHVFDAASGEAIR